MMIDLRSDTLTRPAEEMRKAMYAAEVGDAGRTDANGRGEDPTVNRLEDMAAQLMGKEAAMLVPSGSMGNLAALMTHCSAGSRVAVEESCMFIIMKRPLSWTDRGDWHRSFMKPTRDNHRKQTV
jgi:threonine aldolase